jgi:hypothetical protein
MKLEWNFGVSDKLLSSTDDTDESDDDPGGGKKNFIRGGLGTRQFFWVVLSKGQSKL